MMVQFLPADCAGDVGWRPRTQNQVTVQDTVAFHANLPVMGLEGLSCFDGLGAAGPRTAPPVVIDRPKPQVSKSTIMLVAGVGAILVVGALVYSATKKGR